jgi:hypothetical protein
MNKYFFFLVSLAFFGCSGDDCEDVAVCDTSQISVQFIDESTGEDYFLSNNITPFGTPSQIVNNSSNDIVRSIIGTRRDNEGYTFTMYTDNKPLGVGSWTFELDNNFVFDINFEIKDLRQECCKANDYTNITFSGYLNSQSDLGDNYFNIFL